MGHSCKINKLERLGNVRKEIIGLRLKPTSMLLRDICRGHRMRDIDRESTG